VLRTRVRTALVALPAVLAIVLFAPVAAFKAFIFLLALWGLREIAEMIQATPAERLAIAAAGGLPAIGAWWTAPAPGAWMGALVVFALMLGLVIWVGRDGPGGFPRGVLLAVIGASWVGVLFPYFAQLRNRPGGTAMLILMFFLVVASDSGAYFAGRIAGRIKLLPKVSPNKTVEGAIGGLAACIIAAVVLRPLLAPGLTRGALVTLGIGIGLLAQIGDLANSAYKRIAGVKDSGWIFPGHGGLLDRTCSLVFVAALTYYYTR
jgi:phosphatidate cytidylyltransferase